MSFDWEKLRKEMSEDMQDLIRRYQMFSKDIIAKQFKKEVNK